MRLTDRDVLLFKMLNKFRVLKYEHIMYFCGFNTYETLIKRLRILIKEKYIDRYREDLYHPYVYFIAQKGIDILFEPKATPSGKINHKNPPKIVKNNIEHELLIASIVQNVLSQNPELSIDDIELDREYRSSNWKNMKADKGFHIPDIRISKYRFIIEVERNNKKKTELFKNISSNHFYYQLWFVPNSRKGLKDKIEKQAMMEMNTSIEVAALEEFDEYNFSLKEKMNKLYEENPSLKERLERMKRLQEEKQLQMNL